MATFAPKKNRTDQDYRDLDLNFFAHPTTGDVSMLEGEDAIKRSVRNLVFTNFYERPFRSHVGSAARQMLFENPDPMVATALKEIITSLLHNFEPRVALLDLSIAVDFDRNGLIVELYFTIKNNGQPLTVSVFLENIRR